MNAHALPGDARLVGYIKQQIRESASQAIPFYEYMRHCLYHPEFGYYMNGVPKVGKEGDFYTSSSIGTLMGEMLAVSFGEYWKINPPANDFVVAEWGGGTGRLAGQVLDEMKDRLPAVYEKLSYILVDTSPYHRSLQSGLDGRHADKLRVIAPDEWENRRDLLPDRAIVFSNELIDAFPVHRYVYRKSSFLEIYVGLEEDGNGFMEKLVPVHADRETDRFFEQIAPQLTDGQQIEYNPAARKWICGIAGKLSTGMLVTIDYGDLAEKLYVPSRMKGTFLCYHRHQAHDNPYVNIGEQDMTAHVNFSSCIEAGEASGFTDWNFETQAQFLIRNGILNRLQSHTESDPFHPVQKRNRAIRQLLLGDSMGELFKVLTQKKDG